MTAKGLFWMFLGPAVWAAILLWTTSDKAHGVVNPAKFETDRGAAIAADIPKWPDRSDGPLQADMLPVRDGAPTCLAIDQLRRAQPSTTPIRS